MPGLRDHQPFVIEQFGGLWARGDAESCPSDHFTQADNIQFFNSGFETRPPLDKYSLTSLGDIWRIYDYVTQTGQTLLVLTSENKIYHIIPQIGSQIIHGPILTIPTMEDFGFVAIAGRAYISPFRTHSDRQGRKYQLGLQNESLYVYNGSDTPLPAQARKAAGLPPISVTPMIAVDGAAGNTDIGDHLIAVVYETDSGYLTALGPLTPPPALAPNFTKHTFTGVNKIDISNIPRKLLSDNVTPDPVVKKRHLVSTKAITDYNNDQLGYQFFFIPNGNIDNNTATTHTVQYFDSDLVADASHLIDNFSEIPAGVNLNTYHSRLVSVGEYGTTGSTVMKHGKSGAVVSLSENDNRSVARLSMPGEPEAINKIDGLIIAPLDGNPLTNCQEFRDVLYLFKKTRTYAYSDNRDEPATWQEEVVDQGVGVSVHGIATVLDTGGVNVDFLLIADWSGLMIFNGVYARPELTWKIEDYWASLDRNNFHQIQVVNDSLSKKIWITIPYLGVNPGDQRYTILHADYGDGLDARNIQWSKWNFDTLMISVCLIETNKLVLGAVGVLPGPIGGLYFINPKKSNFIDSYYGIDKKIPDPTIRTALFGE